MPTAIFISIFLMFLAIFLNISSSTVFEREMKMVVISKDKTKCAEYVRFAVTKSYVSGKNNKYALTGCVNQHQDILDLYPTQEEAVAVLEKIFAAYQNGEKTFVI